MVQLNDKKFLYSTIGATLIITGAVLQRMFPAGVETNLYNFIDNINLGNLLTAVGWIIIPLSIATTTSGSSLFDLRMNNYGALAVFASALIFIGTMNIKEAHNKFQTPELWAISAFTGGWSLLTIALIAQSKLALVPSALAVGGTLLMVTSKLGAIPWQKNNQISDGPGWPMKAFAWFMIVMSNSIVV